MRRAGGMHFLDMRAVGLFANRIGSEANSPLEVDTFTIPNLATRESEYFRMRNQEKIFQLPASVKRPGLPRVRTQRPRLNKGDGYWIASGLTLIRSLRAQAAEGFRIEDIMGQMRANIASEEVCEIRPSQQGGWDCVSPARLVHIQT